MTMIVEIIMAIETVLVAVYFVQNFTNVSVQLKRVEMGQYDGYQYSLSLLSLGQMQNCKLQIANPSITSNL